MRFRASSTAMTIVGGALALALAAPLSGGPSEARAEVPVSAHENLRDDDTHQAYIEGLGRGIFWTSALLVSRTGLSLFCLPGEASLSADDILMILDQQLEQGEYPDDAPIELAMVHGFMNAFPCQQPTQPPAEEQDRGDDPFADPD